MGMSCACHKTRMVGVVVALVAQVVPALAATEEPFSYRVPINRAQASVVQNLLEASPASLAFAPTAVGQPSEAQVVRLTNTGTYRLPLLSFAGAGASDFLYDTSACQTALEPGASCAVGVSMVPQARGARSASVTVNYGSGTPLSVGFAGAGLEGVLVASTAVVGFPGTVLTQRSAPKVVELSNVGDYRLGVTQVVSDTTDFQVASGCTELAPGDKCSVTVEFAPATVGPRTGLLAITDSAGGAAQVAATGQGVDVVRTVGTSAQVLALPATVVGAKSPEQSVLFTNGGNLPVTASGVTMTPADAYSFTHTCTGAIQPGESCSAAVTFGPAARGAHNAVLSLQSDAANSPSSIPVTGAGLQGQLAVSTPAFFGSVVMGQTSVQPVTITNAGDGPLSVTATAASDAAYTVDRSACATLAPSQSCIAPVTFAPSAPGASNAQLTVTGSAGTAVSAPLAGDGLAQTRTLQAAPASVALGAVPVGASAAPGNLTLTNKGNTTVRVTGMSVTAGATEFTQTNTCGTQLLAGASCQANIGFIPGVKGARAGVLSVLSDSDAGALNVSISGTGLQGVANVAPSSLAFGSIAQTKTSTAQTVVVKNAGDSSMTVTGVSVSTGFTQTNNCGAVLPASASCSVQVTFAPTQVQAYSGSLVVQHTGQGGSISVAVSGQGVALFTYSWQAGNWSVPAACGATTATRSVTCLRSDGTTVANSFCSATAAPATTTPSSDYSACGYNFSYSGWSTPAGCGAVTMTRTATCYRTDGTAVAQGYCGTPVLSQGGTNYSACGYNWQVGGFSPTAGCGSYTQSRSVTCYRSDGAVVSDAYCGARPTSSQTATDYNACSYNWVVTSDWYIVQGACAARNVACRRTDGADMPYAYCGGGGPAYFMGGSGDVYYAPQQYSQGSCD